LDRREIDQDHCVTFDLNRRVTQERWQRVTEKSFRSLNSACILILTV